MNTVFEYTDIIILGLAIAAIAILGFIVLFNNPKSSTNRAFFVFTLSGIVWGLVNFAAYQAVTANTSLWLWRLVLFTAVWFCFCIFQLSEVFPESESSRQGRSTLLIVLSGVILVSLATLTPLVFVGLSGQPTPGRVPEIISGPLLPFFGISVALLVIAAIYRFIQRAKRSGSGSRAVPFIIAGTGTTFALLIICNFVLPTMFRIYAFIPFGAVFLLPFVLCTGYAIGRYHLFNVRLVTAELFSFLLVIATLTQILFSSSLFELIFRIGSFILVLALAILFVRNIIEDIKQRETIEKQEKDLEIINAQQENILHFISHEIKGYLTKSEAAFSEIVQGDFGPVTPDLQSMATMALADVRRGVRTVIDILDAANLKKGTVSFKKDIFDMKDTVSQMVEHLKPDIDAKHLTVETSIAWEVPCKINGDETKIKNHIVRNLIDNAVKYTPTGTIKVTLVKADGVVRLTVKDSGVGITDEDKKRLFTEGGHGVDSIKVNVNSTGYGLYIAKQVTDAHGGKIWAESEGPGKGSSFIVELPAAS